MIMEKAIKIKNQRTRARIITLFSFIVLLGLNACDKSTNRQDLELFVSEIKSKPKNDIDKLPEEQKTTIVKYLGINKRSPFVTSDQYVRSQVGESNSTNKPDISRAKEVLENYKLRTLKMVGTLKKSDGTYWALILDENNIIHKVKVGNYIGSNFGKITKVSDKEIEINELISDSLGSWRNNTVIMQLQD